MTSLFLPLSAHAELICRNLLTLREIASIVFTFARRGNDSDSDSDNVNACRRSDLALLQAVASGTTLINQREGDKGDPAVYLLLLVRQIREDCPLEFRTAVLQIAALAFEASMRNMSEDGIIAWHAQELLPPSLASSKPSAKRRKKKQGSDEILAPDCNDEEDEDDGEDEEQTIARQRLLIDISFADEYNEVLRRLHPRSGVVTLEMLMRELGRCWRLREPCIPPHKTLRVAFLYYNTAQDGDVSALIAAVVSVALINADSEILGLIQSWQPKLEETPESCLLKYLVA